MFNEECSIKLFRFSTVLFLCVCMHASLVAAEKILLEDNFSDDSGHFTSTGAVITDGKMRLDVKSQKKHSGSQFTYKQPFRLPENPDAFIKISFIFCTLGSAEGNDAFPVSARFFIAPEPLPVFREPYSMPTCFILWLEKKNSKDSPVFRLYMKTEEEKSGLGKCLYEGRPVDGKLPLKISLYINREVYRLVFGNEVETNKGARSGEYSYGNNIVWSENLRFGGRIVNHADGNKGRVEIQQFNVSRIDP